MKRKTLFAIALIALASAAQATTLAEAIDMPGASITTSGYGWEASTDQAQTGGYCARSRNYHCASTTASMTLTVAGPGRISFRWYAYGESGYDYLYYTVDGGSNSDPAPRSWETVTHDISGTGTHTITWSYRKDGGVDTDPDRGYVDCVTWTPKVVQTYYVNRATGDDSNTGLSAAAAKATIQNAINAASEGDIIMVAEGTYAPISVNKCLTIQGSGADKTIIDGGNSARCAYFSGTDGYVLKNVKLQNGYVSGSFGAGAYRGTLYDCVIDSCRVASSDTYGGGGADSSCLYDCVVQNCVARHGAGLHNGRAYRCVIKGNRAESSGGGAHSVTMYNCLIIENSANENCRGGGAIWSTLYNCTVARNAATGYSYGGGGIDSCYSYNCISYGNTSSYSSSYNNYYRSTSGCFENSCQSDPKFRDAANGDYRLASNSPCIDAGYNYSSIGDTDLDGHARIVNGRVDIGCYEYLRLFSVAANSTPLANTYKLSWELADGAREGQVKLDGNVLAATTNDVENYIWQPTTTGSHKFVYTSGEEAVTQTVNVTALSFAGEPTPNPPMSRDANIAITPPTRSMTIGGGSRTVTTSGSGTWTAAVSDSWITLKATSGSAGTSVAYTVAASEAIGERVGYVYVSGYTHTITQSGYEADASPTTVSAGPEGKTGTIAVSMSGRYAWTARPNCDWISLSKTSGTGEDTVTFTVAPFTEITTRTGTMTIAGKTVTVTQTGRTMRISSNAGTFDYYTHAIPITVDALASTEWRVTPNASWISVVTPASGSGRGGGPVGLSIGENPSYRGRTGTVTIGTQTYTVTQSGRPADKLSFAIAPPTTTASVLGANGSIAVTATPDLPWTVTSQASWLTIASGKTGAGNGNIAYTVQPNPTLAERTGTITVTPEVGTAKTQTVTQPAAVSEISSSSYVFDAAGESCTVTVTVDAHVEWTVAESISWISVSGETSTRVGPATLTITAWPNDSIDARGPATMTIAGHTFSVSQTGRAVTVVDNNDNQVYGTESSDGTIDIHVDGEAAWHAEPSYSWITIVSEESGIDGYAQITYTIDDYLGDGKSRTGWITIGGTKVYITQRSYEFDINPKARTVDGNNGAGEIGISAPIGAIWDAIATEPWISIIKDYDPTTGNGTIHYTFTENDTGRNRTGRIIINGEAYTITQMKRLKVNVEGRGGVTIAGTYGAGAQMTLTATNAADYAFSQWKRDGVAAGTTNPKQVVIEDVERMTAVFSPVPPTATATTDVREGVRLTWTAPAWANNYNIYRSTSTTKPSDPSANVATGTTYSDTSAGPGTLYYYWVEAVGSQETATSAAVSGRRRVSIDTVTVSGQDAVFSGMSATYSASSLLNSGAACTSGTRTWSVVGSAATINSATGQLTANAVTVDTTVTVRCAHTYDGITVTGEKIVAIRPTVALNTLVGGGLSSVSTSGTTSWFGQKYDTCEGANAARSPALASGQSAWFSSSVTGPGTLTFKWRTTATGERLAFGVGSDVTDCQEESTPDWQTVTKVYRDNATRAFRWTYTAGANNGYALVGGIVWTPAPANVSVTFNLQDGETANSEQSYATGRTFGTLLTPPARAGYTFSGWFTTPSCTAASKVETSDYVFVEDTTLYAKWTANRYTVVFFKVGGTGTLASQIRTYDVAQSLPRNTFTRAGYDFLGWSTSSNGALAYRDGTDPGNLATANGATVNLFAKWAARSYTIRFSANGGTGAMDDLSMTYDVAKTLPACKMTKTGYTFQGWAKSSGGAVAYANGASVKNLTTTSGQVVTLYAVWKANSYVVDFNPGAKGQGSMADQTMTYDTSAALNRNSYTCPGYTFVGWTDDPLEAEEYEYLDGFVVLNLTDEADGEYDLYAVWAPNDYEVWYDPNRGWGTMAVTPCTYDEETSLSANAFYRASHAFVGWATSASGPVAYGDRQKTMNLRTTANSAMTLYAVWAGKTGNAHKVTFGRNGGEGGPDSITVIQGAKGASIVPPTRKGYTFGGYWTTLGASGVQYYTSAGAPTKAWDRAAGATLWAKWTVNTYKITLGKNGGTGGDDRVTVNYGAVPHDITVPKRTDYTFAGYWTTTGTGGIQYYSAAGKATRAWDRTSDTTLWAKWTPMAYRITLGKNGGTGGDNYVTVSYGAKPHDIGVPKKAGYAFGGYWTTTGTGGIQYYSAAGKALKTMDRRSDLALWAKWVKTASQVMSGEATSPRIAPASQLPSVGGYSSLPRWTAGYYRGTFGDVVGTFDLMIDDSPVSAEVEAYFAAQTENGSWSDECEAEVVGETLVLAFEDRVIVVRMSDGTPIATYATSL